jgi:hypothetical protein
MRSVAFALLVLLGSAGGVQAREAGERSLSARAQRVQEALFQAQSAAAGNATPGASAPVRKFGAAARRTWAALPEKEREAKLLSIYRVNEGQIEAAMFDRKGYSRRAGVNSLGSAAEHFVKLVDVPIEKVVPASYMSRLQRRWRRVAFSEAKRDLKIFRNARPIELRAGKATLAAHIDRVENEALAGPGSDADKRELGRQLQRLRTAVARAVGPDGRLDKAHLEAGIDVVQYLFSSPLTRAHNDLTNAVSQRFFFLRSVAYAFPRERVD